MDPRFTAAPLRLLAVLGATCVLCATSPATAEADVVDTASDRPPASEAPEEQRAPERLAEEHLARGLEHYGQKHYTQAIVEFRAGYAISADVRLLYALAQSLRLAGQCAEAITRYQEFLDREPSPAQADAARANLERCREQAKSANPSSERTPRPTETAGSNPRVAPPPTKTESSGPAGSSPNQPDVDDRSEPFRPVHAPPLRAQPAHSPPWYTDTMGGALTGGGILSLGVGVTLLVVANSKRAESEQLKDGATEGTYQQHADRLDRGRAQSVGGGLLTLVGLTAVVLGTLRYRRVASERSVELALTVAPSRIGAALEGKF